MIPSATDHEPANDPGKPVLSVDDVGFSFPGRRPLFEHVSADVLPGQRIRIHGASGAGKTTLMRLMAGLELPTSGTIRFNGTDLRHLPPPTFRSKVCYLQQVPVVLEASVRANLLLPFSFAVHARRSVPDEAALRQHLAPLFPEGITLDQPATELSVGQKQRVCFARALLTSPRVLLLDEPVSALDGDSARLVLSAAMRANRTLDTALVMNTHAAESHEFVPDRRLVIDGGRVTEASTP